MSDYMVEQTTGDRAVRYKPIVVGLKNQEQRMGSDFSFSQLLLDTAASGGKFTR